MPVGARGGDTPVLLWRGGHVHWSAPKVDETRHLMTCVRCGNTETRRDGRAPLGGQRWRCDGCGRRFSARSTSAFSRHRLPDDVIALAVRWYARFRLSYADVAEWAGRARV